MDDVGQSVGLRDRGDLMDDANLMAGSDFRDGFTRGAVGRASRRVGRDYCDNQKQRQRR